MAIDTIRAFPVTPLALQTPYGGIPVPGQVVSPLSTFALQDNSCQSGAAGTNVADSLQLLGARAAPMAQKTYNTLYYAVAEVDVRKMLGRWFVAGASAELHMDGCAVAYGG